MVYFGCYLGAIAINMSFTALRGVMLVESVPNISSSPFSRFWIYSVQFDKNAAHLLSLPLRPEDCTSQANVK